MTVNEFRSEIRHMIEMEHPDDVKPLRKRELHRAYYCLSGDKLSDVSIAEVRYKLLEEAGLDVTPFEVTQPFTKSSLAAVLSALREKAQTREH